MIRTFALAHGFSVEFQLEAGAINCVWSPHVPTGKRARQLVPAYRKARDHFLGSLGLNVLVIEL